MIVLYKLCAILRELGYNAKVWPSPKPGPREIFSPRGVKKALRWHGTIAPILRLKPRIIMSPYDIPIARIADLAGSIAIYPEVVAGNPLGAKRVVRWLLNRPRTLNENAVFSERESFFYYHEHFNDWDLNPSVRNQLRVVELMGDVYRRRNHGTRSGTCYMVRKGEGRVLDHHGSEAINVDGLSHRELAKVFNDCKYFVSYDPYTMYSRYAAMCGCIPVVVPREGISKEQWRPEVENRLGIAYGWDDISWAVETREDLMRLLDATERHNIESVRKFVQITSELFVG